jgi:C-terminal processing protease CtpA/Prc
VAHLLAGPLSSPAVVWVRGLEGHVRPRWPLRFLLDDEGRYRQRFGFLPETLRAQRIDPATGYIALPDFEPGRAKEFFEALEPLRELPVLLIDLRGNPGGRIQTLQRVAAAFFEKPTELLEMKQDDASEIVLSTEAPFRYEGEVRILIDARTGSAAELFAAALQDVRGARLVGATTAGSTRSRRTARLPGGVLFHYAGRAEFRRLDGRAIEGVGIRPDVEFRPSRAALATGHFGDAPRDPTVQRALSLN